MSPGWPTVIVTTSPTMCPRSSADRPAHSSGSPSTTPRRSHEATAATVLTPPGVIPAVATSTAFASRGNQPAERPPDDHQHGNGNDGSDQAPARAHDEG